MYVGTVGDNEQVGLIRDLVLEGVNQYLEVNQAFTIINVLGVARQPTTSCTVWHELSLSAQCETKAVTTKVRKLTQPMAVKKVDVGVLRGPCYIAAEFCLILTEEGLCTILQIHNGDDNMRNT